MSLARFLAILLNYALLQLPNENLYMLSRGINSPIKNGPTPLWLFLLIYLLAPTYVLVQVLKVWQLWKGTIHSFLNVTVLPRKTSLPGYFSFASPGRLYSPLLPRHTNKHLLTFPFPRVLPINRQSRRAL